MKPFVWVVMLYIVLPFFSFSVVASGCPTVKITKKLFSADKKNFNTSINEIDEMKLLYPSDSGVCLPTRDTYFISYDGNEPKIIFRVEGHSPNVDFKTFDEHYIAVVTYYAGGNQYIMEGYEIDGFSFQPVKGFKFISNMRHIKFIDNNIEVKNIIINENNDQEIEVKSHHLRELFNATR